MTNGCVNKATLIGSVSGDAETRTLGSGRSIVTFNLATRDAWTDGDAGGRTETVEWHRVTIIGDRPGGIAGRCLARDAKVCVEGRMRARKWTDEAGIERHGTEIVLDGSEGWLTVLAAGADGQDHPSRRDGRAAHGQPAPAGARAGGEGGPGPASGSPALRRPARPCAPPSTASLAMEDLAHEQPFPDACRTGRRFTWSGSADSIHEFQVDGYAHLASHVRGRWCATWPGMIQDINCDGTVTDADGAERRVRWRASQEGI